MKTLLGIFFALAPTAFHFFFDRITVLHFKKSVNHLMSAIITVSIMALGIFNKSVEYWWQTPSLALAFHYLIFDALFNALVLNKPINYFGSNPIDRFHSWLQDRISPQGLIFIRIIIFLSALKFYIDPCVYDGCNPF